MLGTLVPIPIPNMNVTKKIKKELLNKLTKMLFFQIKIKILDNQNRLHPKLIVIMIIHLWMKIMIMGQILMVNKNLNHLILHT